MKPNAIPVVMFHGVGGDRPGWPWNHLLTPVDVFEGQMRLLAREGWHTISLAALHSHMAAGTPVPEKAIVLTFDDGYRDNWVNMFPILKKYGHRAAIWISTDFVDPRSDLPPTLEDVWAGRIRRDQLDERGYLSWREMREMVSSGLVEIQSHAKTHTWYFSGPHIVDIHRPESLDGYRMPPWLFWNRFPAEKHASMNEVKPERIPYGTPIYEHGESLVVRRYFEDEGLAEDLAIFVAGSGGAEFFRSAGWRERILAVAQEYGKRDDRLETEDEYRARVRAELVDSKRVIETALGTTVEFLCWPGGAHTDFTRRLAEEVGYLATTTRYEDWTRRNVFGEDAREINRIGSGSPWVWRNVVVQRTDPGYFMAGLDLFRGDKKSVWRLRWHKLKYLLRYFLFRVT
jgi:peptidoglycan/xylan/chitin deacetylase (PgdA/CDA1 family)